MELDKDLQAFVEREVGAITSIRRPEAGSSRITYLIEAQCERCVLRVDGGDGSMSDTPLDLAREAAAYRALSGSDVRIPTLLGETHNALLMSWIPGSPDLASAPTEIRHAIMDDYIGALAELHRVDTSSGFAALDPPESASRAAQHWLALWTRIYRSKVRRPSPLAEFATQWMARTAPTDATRLSVCHGDPGPGNFMHESGKVTGLFDWEFVHIGDPMDDLGWLSFRGHHLQLAGDIGDLEAQIALWEKQSGFAASRRRIAWYRIMTMYVYLVSCLSALDGGSKDQDRFIYLNLIDLLHVTMPRAMMMYAGLALPDAEVNLEAREGDTSEQISALVDLMRIRLRQDDAQVGYVGMMARQALDVTRLGPSIAAQNANAVSALIGRRIAPADEHREFRDWIARGAAEGREERVLQTLLQNGLRRIEPNTLFKDAALAPLHQL